MNVKKVVNLFCLIVGIAVLIFGCVVRAGMIPTAEPGRSLTMFVLGGIIVLWALVSMRRNR